MRGIFGFFVGIFGAMAILGVFFKILKWDHYELFMSIGFLGEVAVFIVMGVFDLVGAFSTQEQNDPSPALVAETTGATAVPSEVGDSFRRMIDKQVGDELNTIMGSLSCEVQ